MRVGFSKKQFARMEAAIPTLDYIAYGLEVVVSCGWEVLEFVVEVKLFGQGIQALKL